MVFITPEMYLRSTTENDFILRCFGWIYMFSTLFCQSGQHRSWPLLPWCAVNRSTVEGFPDTMVDGSSWLRGFGLGIFLSYPSTLLDPMVGILSKVFLGSNDSCQLWDFGLRVILLILNPFLPKWSALKLTTVDLTVPLSYSRSTTNT